MSSKMLNHPTPKQIEELFVAISKGQLEKVDKLIQQRSELAVATNAQGIRPVMWAMYHRQTELARRLYQALEQPQAEEALAVDDLAGLARLLDQQPELIHRLSTDGFSLLHYACFFASERGVIMLLERGADVEQRAENASQVCPIHSAAAARSAAIVSTLLQAGANANVQQSGGYTALMSAASHNETAMIEALLNQGADTALLDDQGKSAYQHGLDKGFTIPVLKP